MLNSNYKAKGRPSSDEVCSSLSERYSNIEYVNSEPFITSNNVSYCLTGEVVDGYITKSFDIIISYEFSRKEDGLKYRNLRIYRPANIILLESGNMKMQSIYIIFTLRKLMEIA